MAKFLFSAFADEASPDILEQIAACKANGIEYIELRNVNGKNISNFTVEEAKELKKLLDDNGMKVSSIGSHYGKIEIDDDFAPHFEAFKQTVEVAKVLAENGFSWYVRPDHGRMIWGETGKPGYGLFDRALGATYINGLFEALEKEYAK